MSSMSKALRNCVQPVRNSAATFGWSVSRSNRVVIASGAVVTWLNVSAVAKILTRRVSIARGTYDDGVNPNPSPMEGR
jgi:hypothetical protein